MEASGCALRQLPRTPASLLRFGPGDMGLRRAGPARVYVGGGGFFDEGHLRYYARCGGKAEKKEEKRRAKLVKSLSKDLSVLMEGMTVGQGDGMVREAASGNTMAINEAASVLLAHLEEARASAKAMKKQEKETKKALKKAMKMNKMGKCDDSSSSSSESSSSESSESDCEEQQVVDMGRLRTTSVPPQTVVDVPATSAVCIPPPALPKTNSTALQIPEQKLDPVTSCCSGNSNVHASAAMASGNMVIEVPARHVSDSFAVEETGVGAPVAGVGSTASSMVATSLKDSASRLDAAVTAPMDRIEVCVGGKCKKSGSLQLMEELQRQVGAQGAVVGCKCMGKCKEGPNVRMSHQKEDGASPVRGPLCIGVGLEDVGAIVSSYLGDGDLGLMAAPA